MSAKVNELPQAANPIGVDIYGAEGGVDVRLVGGGPLGLATLGADGKIPAGQLPAVVVPAHTHDAADRRTAAPARCWRCLRRRWDGPRRTSMSGSRRLRRGWSEH